jgi:hypothetical protein
MFLIGVQMRVKSFTLGAATFLACIPVAQANTVVWAADVVPYPTSILDVSTSKENQVSGISTAIFDVNSGQYRFQGFCIEIEQKPWSSNPYTRTVMSKTDARYGLLSKLYENWFGATKTSATATSAFGATIWEIQYDAGKPLSFSNGEFRINSASSDVLSLANTMLSSVLSATAAVGSWEFTIWDNPVDQALLEGKQVPAIVPLPATAGLLGLGLLALSRRRKTQV